MSPRTRQSKWASRLPAELRVSIIDHLSSDFCSLGSLALTCRSWSTPSQTALFRYICLQGSLRYMQLEALLDEAPHIAAYIHTLAIVCDGTYTWMDQCATRILFRLRDVEELSLRNWCATVMTDETRLGFVKCFPKVKTMHMQDVAFTGNDLAILLCACPSLTRLNLHDVHWSHRQKALLPASPLGDTCIESLYFQGTSPLVLTWLTKDGPLGFCLRSIEIGWEHPAVTADVARALERSGAELEHATLVCNIRTIKGVVLLTDWLPPPLEDNCPLQLDLTLAHNTRLRTLYLRVECNDGRSVLVGWIPQLLDTLRTPEIREIRFDLRSADLVRLPWHETDTRLAQLATVQPHLAVNFYISCTDAPGADAVHILEHIVSGLPRLVSATERLGVDCRAALDVDELYKRRYGGLVALD